jgi:hypothetical protein
MRALLLQTSVPLVCFAGLLAAQAPNDRPHSDAVQAILDLAGKLDAMDVARRAENIVKKYDSCDISQTFTLRKRGGVGIGTAAENANSNSIDHLVRRWSGNKAPTAKELQAHQADLLKAARVLQAMAELAPFRIPAYKDGDKRIGEWLKVSADFKVLTRELREGIQRVDPAGVRKTSLKLQQTCNQCHTLVF